MSYQAGENFKDSVHCIHLKERLYGSGCGNNVFFCSYCKLQGSISLRWSSKKYLKATAAAGHFVVESVAHLRWGVCCWAHASSWARLRLSIISIWLWHNIYYIIYSHLCRHNWGSYCVNQIQSACRNNSIIVCSTALCWRLYYSLPKPTAAEEYCWRPWHGNL